jgi:hypothetical protein
MHFFWKPYKSELTQHIESLKAQRPALEAEQRAGRALLWDRTLDAEQRSAWAGAKVPQQPYVYQTRTDS